MSPRLGLMAALALLSGCSSLGGGSCREPAIPANPPDLPALQAAEGLDPPDTRNAVKVPELNEPQRTRSRDEPCLSSPPSYGSS